MYSGKTVFAQLMEWIHPEEFRRCVTRYFGHYRVREFTCWEQFLAMAFAQMTFRESLSDIEVCLRSRRERLYHLGFRSPVAEENHISVTQTKSIDLCLNLFTWAVLCQERPEPTATEPMRTG